MDKKLILDAMDEYKREEGAKTRAYINRIKAEAVRDFEAELLMQARSLPLGHEMPSKGCSTFNWMKHAANLASEYANKLERGES